jgi:hypothetical protein
MNLCSDGHGEVCYEDRHCPACAVREDMQDDIDNLKDELNECRNGHLDEVRELNDVIRDLNARLADAERQE